MKFPSDEQLIQNPSLRQYLPSYKKEAKAQVTETMPYQEEWENVLRYFFKENKEKSKNVPEDKRKELVELRKLHFYYKWLGIELNGLNEHIKDIYRLPYPNHNTITLDLNTRVDNLECINEFNRLSMQKFEELESQVSAICYPKPLSPNY